MFWFLFLNYIYLILFSCLNQYSLTAFLLKKGYQLTKKNRIKYKFCSIYAFTPLNSFQASSNYRNKKIFWKKKKSQEKFVCFTERRGGVIWSASKKVKLKIEIFLTVFDYNKLPPHGCALHVRY